jgi:hypothetical protein
MRQYNPWVPIVGGENAVPFYYLKKGDAFRFPGEDPASSPNVKSSDKGGRYRSGTLGRTFTTGTGSAVIPVRAPSQGGKRRHGGDSKNPSWKKIVVLKDGVPIHKTRKYWKVLDHYLDFGQAPAGYEVKLPASAVNSMGMAEEVERRAAKRSRKPRAAIVAETGAAEPGVQKLAAEVADLLK